MPELILSTLEPPVLLPVRGEAVLIQARVCRPHNFLRKAGSKNVSWAWAGMRLRGSLLLVRRDWFAGGRAVA